MNRLYAVLLGGLIGVGVALLVAPDSGEATRRKLRNNLDDLQDKTQEQLRMGRMRVSELIKSSQDTANDLLETAHDKVANPADREAESLDRG